MASEQNRTQIVMEAAKTTIVEVRETEITVDTARLTPAVTKT